MKFAEKHEAFATIFWTGDDSLVIVDYSNDSSVVLYWIDTTIEMHN